MGIRNWLIKKLVPQDTPDVWKFMPTKEMFHPILLESMNSDGFIRSDSPFVAAIEEPVPYCFTFPLFSEDYCKFLIDQGDKVGKWELNHSDPFTAYEQKIQRVNPFIYRYHKEVVCFNTINHIMSGLYNGFKATELINAFLIKYQMDTCKQMRLHHDEDSLISLSINLNDDFEGSGLGFARHPGKIIVGKPGWPVMFAGNPVMTHQAHPITKGTRQVLVYWLS